MAKSKARAWWRTANEYDRQRRVAALCGTVPYGWWLEASAAQRAKWNTGLDAVARAQDSLVITKP
jgi:hypothetical protein